MREYGEEYVTVTKHLLASVRSPLQVVWASSSMTIKMTDPGGSGSMLSLLTIPIHDEAFYFVAWLRDQLDALWDDSAAGERVMEAHAAGLIELGARVTPGGEHYKFELAMLDGKEGRFVAHLEKVAGLISAGAASASP